MIPQISLLLHNIRSAHNVGSIFRTADATGVSKIYLSGHTPTPIDRFGRMRKDIAKVSLGAEKDIDWESVNNVEKLIKKLKKENFEIVGLEQDKRSVDYRDYRVGGKALVILGEEVKGVTRYVLDLCDQIIEIPMHGKKESLNVSVAAGIILYALR